MKIGSMRMDMINQKKFTLERFETFMISTVEDYDDKKRKKCETNIILQLNEAYKTSLQLLIQLEKKWSGLKRQLSKIWKSQSIT